MFRKSFILAVLFSIATQFSFPSIAKEQASDGIKLREKFYQIHRSRSGIIHDYGSVLELRDLLLGNEIFAKKLKDVAKELVPTLPVYREQYAKLMEEAFGPTLSEDEKKFRGEFFWLCALYERNGYESLLGALSLIRDKFVGFDNVDLLNGP